MATDDKRFHAISITGGPSGHRVEMLKDGERMKGVTRFELTGDVDDVLRLRTLQIVEATVSLRAEHVHAVEVTVLARNEGETANYEKLATSTADTVWEALYDCARQLELAAKKEAETAET